MRVRTSLSQLRTGSWMSVIPRSNHYPISTLLDSARMWHVGFFSESISLQLAKAPELWVGKVVIRRSHIYYVTSTKSKLNVVCPYCIRTLICIDQCRSANRPEGDDFGVRWAYQSKKRSNDTELGRRREETRLARGTCKGSL